MQHGQRSPPAACPKATRTAGVKLTHGERKIKKLRWLSEIAADALTRHRVTTYQASWRRPYCDLSPVSRVAVAIDLGARPSSTDWPGRRNRGARSSTVTSAGSCEAIDLYCSCVVS